MLEENNIGQAWGYGNQITLFPTKYPTANSGNFRAIIIFPSECDIIVCFLINQAQLLESRRPKCTD